MIYNCTIAGNSAEASGGGIYSYAGDFAVIANCTINDNISGFSGGGIVCLHNSPMITNCTINGNTADWGGGGIYCSESSPTINNSTIRGNSAEHGAGICCRESNPAINNCIVSGGTADRGGGIYSWKSSPAVNNCTINGNTADWGGGIYCSLDSNPTMTNSILWTNMAPIGHEIALTLRSTLLVRHSDIQGDSSEAYIPSDCTLDLDGTNIDADPLFVKGRYHEFYLSHIAAGQLVDSPCIDTGSDTALNLGLDELTTRVDSEYDAGIVDMGYHSPPTIWICSITRSGSDIIMQWKARAGLSYVVECSRDPEFSSYTKIPVGEMRSWTYIGNAPLAQRYYRVSEQ
jgi:hypothetical protein